MHLIDPDMPAQSQYFCFPLREFWLPKSLYFGYSFVLFWLSTNPCVWPSYSGILAVQIMYIRCIVYVNDLQYESKVYLLQVDHWLNFANGQLSSSTEYKAAVTSLDSVLRPVTFLVGQSWTVADFAVWEALHCKSDMHHDNFLWLLYKYFFFV